MRGQWMGRADYVLQWSILRVPERFLLAVSGPDYTDDDYPISIDNDLP